MANKKYFGCKIEGCGKEHSRKGFCEYHRSQYRIGVLDVDGNVLRELKKKSQSKHCKINDCSNKSSGKSLCDTHRWQLKNKIIDKDGNKLRELDARSRRGTMGEFKTQAERGTQFIIDRYFEGKSFCKCEHCGDSYEFYQMDGHHPDPSKKTISAQTAKYRHLEVEPEIVEELDTLVWVCSHCHIAHHAGGEDTPYVETRKSKKLGRKIDETYGIIFSKRKKECQDCERSLGRRTTVFHHRDPSTKIADISQIIGCYRQDFVLDEVDKCDILCANCHRKRHHLEDGGSSKVKIDWVKRVRLFEASPIKSKNLRKLMSKV